MPIYSMASVVTLALSLGAASVAAAHHSYSMFDGARTLTVVGTVAKLEWTNPHVYLWVYVQNAASETGYDLYAFQSGEPNVLARRGWSKTIFAPGERLTIQYSPLVDGRTGGHFTMATRADGSVIQGTRGPRGAEGTNATSPVVPRTP